MANPKPTSSIEHTPAGASWGTSRPWPRSIIWSWTIYSKVQMQRCSVRQHAPKTCVSALLSSCSSSLYALCVLRDHGIPWQFSSRSVQSNRDCQAYPLCRVWSALCTAKDRARVTWRYAFLPRSKRCELKCLQTFFSRTWLRYVRVFAVVIRLSVVCNVGAPYLNGFEAFGNISSPLCTLAILWPPYKILRRSSQGNPSAGSVKRKRGIKIERFWTYRSKAISHKRYKIDVWFLLKTNRKSYALYRMVALPISLDDP